VKTAPPSREAFHPFGPESVEEFPEVSGNFQIARDRHQAVCPKPDLRTGGRHRQGGVGLQLDENGLIDRERGDRGRNLLRCQGVGCTRKQGDSTKRRQETA